MSDLAAWLAEYEEHGWRTKARPPQLEPPGQWTVWLLLGGRGSGKTRSGAEWVLERVMRREAKSSAIVGRTYDDARQIQVEGQSGLLKSAPEWLRPLWEPTKGRLSFPNGSEAYVFGAENPDSLIGRNFDTAWCDELASWERGELAWANLMLGLRAGNSRCAVSTTPRPVQVIRQLVGREGVDVRISRMSTWDNAKNLSPQFLQKIATQYRGTRLGRQELEAELLFDTEGALWTRDVIDRTRVAAAPAGLLMRYVGVDPSGGSSDRAAECGIIVVGVDGRDPRHAYVLDDRTMSGSSNAQANAIVSAWRDWKANWIVAEKNMGGDWVRGLLVTVDPVVATVIKLVAASESKEARADPVAALYEQGRIHNVGAWPELEDEMCSWVPGSGRSPNRLDAMVWGMYADRRMVPELDDKAIAGPPAAAAVASRQLADYLGRPRQPGYRRRGVIL